MSHSEDDLPGPVTERQGRDLIEHRDHRVEPLDREDLLAEVGLLDETLEFEDLDQPFEQANLLFRVQRRRECPGLDLLPHPDPLLVG